MASPTAASAKPGQLDRRFSGDGIEQITHSQLALPIAAQADADGRLVIATKPDYQLRGVAFRGGLDPSFGTDGVVTPPRDDGWDGNAQPYALVKRHDGSWVLFGKQTDKIAIADAFDRDGRPLTGFGTAGRATLTTDVTIDGSTVAMVAPDDSVTWAFEAYDGGYRYRWDVPWSRDGQTPAFDALPRARADSPGRSATRPPRIQNSFVVVAAGRDVLAVVAEGNGPLIQRIASGGAGRVRWSWQPTDCVPNAAELISDGLGGAYVGCFTDAGLRSDPAPAPGYVTVRHITRSGRLDRRFGASGVQRINTSALYDVVNAGQLVLDRARQRLWVVTLTGDTSYYEEGENDLGIRQDTLVAALRTK